MNHSQERNVYDEEGRYDSEQIAMMQSVGITVTRPIVSYEEADCEPEATDTREALRNTSKFANATVRWNVNHVLR